MKAPRLHLRTLMVLVALSALFLALVSWLAQLGVMGLGPSETAIHAMGDRLVADIEAWRSKHGHYPSSLAEAGLSSPTDFRGGFRYEADSTRFSLRIGIADGVNVMHSYDSNGWDRFSSSGWYCMD